MNRTYRTVLLTAVALATSTFTDFAEKLIPAGTLIQCNVSENRLSSKTVAIGDPVLCQVGRSSNFPSGTVMSGTFEDYKDPGHLVGKGWMELVFDRLILPSNEIVQVNSKVVAVPHYSVDTGGKILGRGHTTRDTIEWLIPVLWPIDLINLPRRGPRPTLKNESRITIKVMDDMVVPDMAPIVHNQYGFAQRAEHIEPMYYVAPRPPQQVSLAQATPDNSTTFVLNDGSRVHTNGYDYRPNGQLMYRSVDAANYGATMLVGMSDINFNETIATNRQNGIDMRLPPGW